MIRALDLFAGPGGFDLGARALGIDPLGVENDPVVIATRVHAGLTTYTGDVAEVEDCDAEGNDAIVELFGPCDLLIGTPPCPSFSQANDDRAIGDVELVRDCARSWASGAQPIIGTDQLRLRAGVADPRSALTVEPLRYALSLEPRWIVCEQVPPVLPIWQAIAETLHTFGYATWCGILEAERYGVPQTRERAFLIAEHEAPAVHPPPVTHQRFVPGHGAQGELTFEGELKPWRSMADALGWGMTERPAPTVAGAGTAGGGPRPLDGGSHARMVIEREREAGRWKLRNGNQPNATERDVDEPAPTIAFGHNAAAIEWCFERPATTVQGDSRIWPPGHKLNADDVAAGRDHYGDRAGTEAIRVEPHEAAILQGFPADYPWQGTRTQIFGQIGNAVPPALASAVLAELIPAGERAGSGRVSGRSAEIHT